MGNHLSKEEPMNNYIHALGNLIRLTPYQCIHGNPVTQSCEECKMEAPERSLWEELTPVAAKYHGKELVWDHPNWEMDDWVYYVAPEDEEAATKRLDSYIEKVLPSILSEFELPNLTRRSLDYIMLR